MRMLVAFRSRRLRHCRQLLDGHELVALFAQSVDDIRQRLDILRTVAAAVMHEYDRAVVRVFEHRLDDRLGLWPKSLLSAINAPNVVSTRTLNVASFTRTGTSRQW